MHSFQFSNVIYVVTKSFKLKRAGALEMAPSLSFEVEPVAPLKKE